MNAADVILDTVNELCITKLPLLHGDIYVNRKDINPYIRISNGITETYLIFKSDALYVNHWLQDCHVGDFILPYKDKRIDKLYKAVTNI